MKKIFMLLWLSTGSILAATPSNVILITLDTTRRDALSCYGQKSIRTPTLDRLARVSHQFLKAYAPVPQTLPSHASLLTGLDPFEHGLRDNFRTPLDPSVPTIAAILKGRGYRTAAVIASVVLNKRFGLGQGIDAYDDLIQAATGYRRGDEVTSLAVRALDRLKPPFFLWVHYYDPHFPYDAPGAGSSPTPYLGEVRYMDEQLAELVAWLDLGSSVVVVAGDHGELLGEHLESEHGVLLYEGAVQVPLLFHLPGQTRTETHAQAVSLSSVFSSILDVLDLPNPSPRANPSLFSAEPPPPVYLETYHPYFGYNWSPLRGVIRGPYKLIESVRENELFDLEQDHRELANLAGRETARVREMKNALDSSSSEKLLSPAPSGTDKVPLDLQKQIESLGYLGGESGGAAVPTSTDALPLPREVADIVYFVMRKAPMMLREGSQERAVLAEAKQALKRDPHNLALINVAGTATMQLGDLERAHEIFSEGLKIAPSAHTLLGSMGHCLSLMGRRPEAEQFLKRAIQANPFQPAYYANLAQLYLEQKKLQLAQATIDAAHAQGRPGPGLLVVEGMLAMSRAEYPRAISVLEEALRYEPGMRDAMDNLALCYYRTRDYDRAWSALEQRMRRKPMDFRMGKIAFEIALALNKRVDARNIAAGFVEQFPMTEEARTMRDMFPDLP